MKNPNKGGWRVWGNHPIVVTWIVILTGAITVTIFTVDRSSLPSLLTTPTPITLTPQITPVTAITQIAVTQIAVTSTLPETPPVATTIPIATPFPIVGVQAIEAEWPRRMQLERSNSVRVTLIYTAGISITPVLEVPGNAVIIATPIPVGTPGPIQSAFGPDYTASMVAKLAGAAFDIQAVTDAEYQLLNQSRTTWEWNVIPKYGGSQVLNLAIIVKWQSSKGGAPIQYQMWRQRLEVFVDTPIFVSGKPIEILPVITGVVGVVLGGLATFFGPRIYGWIEERIKTKRRQQIARNQRTNARVRKK